MQKRAVQLTIVTLLLVTGLCATYFTWDTFRRIDAVLDVERAADAHLDRMGAAVAALGAAQQAYVAPGQQRGDSLTRASVLVQQLYDDTASLRRIARSHDAGPGLLAFGEAVDGLVKTDDRARQHLRNDEELMAADLVYTEARQALEAMATRLSELQAAERGAAARARGELLQSGATTAGSAVLVWVVGVLALVRTPKRADPAPDLLAPVPVMPQSEIAQPASRLNLGAAAQVCVELSRLPSGAGLAPVLARTARVLDASGVIVWLGAGEELFPAEAYGYSPHTLARLGPVARSSDNATAAAWRTAEMFTVPSQPGSNGAIVAPLCGASGCFGVLAAEVRAGREHDDDTRAVTAMIAAQLSTLVAPWPAPSYAEAPAAGEDDARDAATKAASA